MKSAFTNKKKDKELQASSKEFLAAFTGAVVTSNKDFARIFDSRNFLFFEGGAIEFTDAVMTPLSKFTTRATKLIGAKGGNEKAIRKIALDHAQKGFIDKTEIESSAADLIDAVFEAGSAEFEFLVPNHLVQFEDGVRSFRIGRVRAAYTADIAMEFAQRPLSEKIRIIPGQGFSLQWSSDPPVANIEIHSICWFVTVGAAEENVDEEAKWLIDIAVSLLRLHYNQQRALFPKLGDIEPHPLRPRAVDRVGVRIRGTVASVGGSRVPPAYEIGKEIHDVTTNPVFESKAELLFNPPHKSVAERVSQGLGWLTRGRQAEDRAERLLYFFTAIEALLATDDKTAPVVQTIARHAAVLLTNDVDNRIAAAAEIRSLYSLRSALVHTGNRSVLWMNANNIQSLAEAIFSHVLEKSDLASAHTRFCEGLMKAGYGLPWPLPKDQIDPTATN